MNLTISKSEFYSTLQLVSRAISPNSPKTSLRGLKIDVKDNTMTVTGSDADISIQKVITADDKNNLKIIEDGSILIESKYLLEIVRKIDNDTIQVEIIDGSLTKFSGNSAVFKINGMNPLDYPTIDFSKPANSVVISSAVLSDIIDQTTFATSIKETKPVLTGVNFHLDGGKLVCTATDSYRLAKKTVSITSQDTFAVTIPSKSLNEVKATMLSSDESSDIEIYLNDKKAQFIGDGMVLQTRLLDGGYPETDRLIPTEFKYELEMSRNDLIHAIDRTTFIKTDNMTINRLQCSQEEIVLTNKSQEIGESHETLVANYTGEPLDISFSGNYVMEAARAIHSDKIKIKFVGEMRPFILSSDEDPSILQLVLPVRTYN